MFALLKALIMFKIRIYLWQSLHRYLHIYNHMPMAVHIYICANTMTVWRKNMIEITQLIQYSAIDLYQSAQKVSLCNYLAHPHLNSYQSFCATPKICAPKSAQNMNWISARDAAQMVNQTCASQPAQLICASQPAQLICASQPAQLVCASKHLHLRKLYLWTPTASPAHQDLHKMELSKPGPEMYQNQHKVIFVCIQICADNSMLRGILEWHPCLGSFFPIHW